MYPFSSALGKKILLCAMSIFLLTSGFFSNIWHIADQQWFITHQSDMESYIIGRMVKSRQDGIFSEGGLIGLGSLSSAPKSDDPSWMQNPPFQYPAYVNGLRFEKFWTYKSQIGGQGMLFSFLNNLIPLSPQAKLQLFHLLTSILSALALTLVIIWFYLEFGLCVGIFALASAVLSQWLVVFGRNLFWSMWAFYLPMIMVMYFLKRHRIPTRYYSTRSRYYSTGFGIVIFSSVLTKCVINGYEYITTTLLMATVPFIYYCILDRLNFRKFMTGTFAVMISSSFAVIVSLSILSLQIWSMTGNFTDGVRHIVYALEKRTYGRFNETADFPPALAASVADAFAAAREVKTVDVVLMYLNGIFFDFNNYISTSGQFASRSLFKIYYSYLVILLLAISIAVYFRRSGYLSGEQRKRAMALIVAAWFSILAPLSWCIIFKTHSIHHLHMNFLAWQMPFTFFVFAVGGLLIESIFRDFIYRRSPHAP